MSSLNSTVSTNAGAPPPQEETRVLTDDFFYELSFGSCVTAVQCRSHARQSRSRWCSACRPTF